MEFHANCPHCLRLLKIPARLAGQRRACPACGESFEVPTGPSPAAEINAALSDASRRDPGRVRHGAAPAGWLCWFLAAGCALIHPALLLLALPLLLAAFVLSILAMAQRRILSGVLLLLASSVYPLVLLAWVMTADIAAQARQRAEEAAQAGQTAPINGAQADSAELTADRFTAEFPTDAILLGRDWRQFQRIPGRARQSELYGAPSLYRLAILVRLRTVPDRPILALAGRLSILDADGAPLWSQAVEHRPSVSFQDSAYEWIKIDYDDSNPQHRSLRFSDQLRAEFAVRRVEFADGQIAEF